MGGYGTYLGFRIRFSDDVVWMRCQKLYVLKVYGWATISSFNVLKVPYILVIGFQEEKAKAKDLHPKLLGGMFFFFALGATGGITSLLTSNKPILERFYLITCNMISFCDTISHLFLHVPLSFLQSSCSNRNHRARTFNHPDNITCTIWGDLTEYQTSSRLSLVLVIFIPI